MMNFINFVISYSQLGVRMTLCFLYMGSFATLGAQERKELELVDVKSQAVYRKSAVEEPVVRHQAEPKKLDLPYYPVTKEAGLARAGSPPARRGTDPVPTPVPGYSATEKIFAALNYKILYLSTKTSLTTEEQKLLVAAKMQMAEVINQLYAEEKCH